MCSLPFILSQQGEALLLPDQWLSECKDHFSDTYFKSLVKAYNHTFPCSTCSKTKSDRWYGVWKHKGVCGWEFTCIVFKHTHTQISNVPLMI